MQEFSTPLGLDVTKWKTNRLPYFKDAYGVFAFLAIWMDEGGMSDFLGNFDDALRSAEFGVALYGILDQDMDSNAPSPVEILAA